MSRFTLCPNRWYAMTCILPGGSFEHSPIWLEQVHARGEGRGQLDINFYHANYPNGVRDKHYRLRTLYRCSSYLLAKEEATEDEEPRVLLLSEIRRDWLLEHLPSVQLSATDPESLAAALDVLTARKSAADAKGGQGASSCT